jgi:hypothetical protein
MPLVRAAFLAAMLALLTLYLAAPRAAANRASELDPYQVIKMVAESNLLDSRTGWLRPSPDYSGSWVRDSFWISGFLGSEVGRRSLAHFGARLSPEGQAPTKLEGYNGPAHYYFDESTLLYLIWSHRDNGQPIERVAQAWDWIRDHVSSDGSYWTPGGTFHTWHDILLFTQRDVASYNQGLYAVAALAAQRMGLADPGDVELAARAYRRLYREDLGYMPVSLRLDYRDSSVLTGEFLARTLFRTSLLEDSLVISTVRMLPRAGDGFVVLSARDGSYLDTSAFFIPMAPGTYQNGGSWLLYDTMAWSAAWMAGAEEARGMAMKRLMAEAREGTLYEFLPTGPVAGTKPPHRDYGWNSYSWFAANARQGEAEPLLPRPPVARDAGASSSRLLNLR